VIAWRWFIIMLVLCGGCGSNHKQGVVEITLPRAGAAANQGETGGVANGEAKTEKGEGLLTITFANAGLQG